jgi:molybdopterin/thiamine biosynthesis adenylyltransferase/NifU-like protein involved in Fe-S cluster formation
MYNDVVLEHLSNPRNVGVIKNADGKGYSGNPKDGDEIVIYIKVQNDQLIDVKFKTFGCGAAIAASSMVTELAIDKKLDEAMDISNDDVAEALGGLPERKLLCSNIAADALHEAIKDYLSKNEAELEISKVLSDSGSKIKENEQLSGLLTKEQTQRYLRQIIMPDISGVGQRKLLDANVLILGQSVEIMDTMLLYSAAAGIGNIYLYTEDSCEDNRILTHIKDLNPDINLTIIDDLVEFLKRFSKDERKFDANVIIGEEMYVGAMIETLISRLHKNVQNIFIAAGLPWKGTIKRIDNSEDLRDFHSDLQNKKDRNKALYDAHEFNQLGLVMTFAYIGVFITSEILKSILDLGSSLEKRQVFNLLDMRFDEITEEQLEDFYKKYHGADDAAYTSIDVSEKLSDSKALIVGTGGLGSPSAYVLAKAGIGTIGLVDFDRVEISNLNRQVIHGTSNIGVNKVSSGKKTLQKLYPDVKIDLHPIAYKKDNAIELVKEYDVIVDGLDNLPTRYLLNDACYLSKKPLISGGAITYYGLLTTLVPDQGPCYRCIFEEAGATGQSCSETGVMGPVPGVIGVLQAIEAIKILVGLSGNLLGRLLMYDARESEIAIINVTKNSSCLLCGDKPSINELQDYSFKCNSKSNE